MAEFWWASGTENSTYSRELEPVDAGGGVEVEPEPFG